MLFKSVSKLFGVLAMVVALGLAGVSVASAANPPSDGGDSSCALDKHNCHLYHFKLDSKKHTIKFTTYNAPCTYYTSKTNFTVSRMNSANIWLDPAVTKYFYINYDGRRADDVPGMDTFSCGNGVVVNSFTNNKNLCWEGLKLRTQGDRCTWR